MAIQDRWRQVLPQGVIDGLAVATQGIRGSFQIDRVPQHGRKLKMTDSKIEPAKALLASGVLPKDVAKNLGVSIPTLYRWVPASAHA